MKLIVAGATGFVATETIRQSLNLPGITSVIALARRPVPLPQATTLGSNNADGTPKFTSVVVKDFGAFSEEEKKLLEGADACIWTLAITPTKARSMDMADVRRVCHDYTVAGLDAMFRVRNKAPGTTGTRPFRFLYMSGVAAERDPKKKPSFMPEYSWMRGATELHIANFAKEHEGEIEVTSVKPGLIVNPGFTLMGTVGAILSAVGFVPKITVSQVSAAMLKQVLDGFEKDPLENEDLVRIGNKALKEISKP